MVVGRISSALLPPYTLKVHYYGLHELLHKLGSILHYQLRLSSNTRSIRVDGQMALINKDYSQPSYDTQSRSEEGGLRN